ncbi:MAG: tetratricopeptide repeat protein, partial [Bacteroidales bacterium]|nr:tetratricopeptide repeat protein [Bacteroidales bacterium]
ERAIINAAKISYDLKDYEQALKLYQQLAEYSEHTPNINMAIIAVMRCQIRLGKDSDIVKSAQNVLALASLTDDVKDEANHAIAVSAQRLGEDDLAKETFDKLLNSKNSEYAAQARYYDIEKLFVAQSYDTAEKKIFEFISETPSSDYYLAKSYLLWGAIYAERGNFLQAKQTFQSIIDNYTGEDDVIDVAKRGYQDVLDKEARLKEMEDEKRAAEAAVEEDIIPLPDEI